MRILGFAFTMVTGGNDTSTGLLGTVLELLAGEPFQREALRADPGLVPGAVGELLRLASPVQSLARTTTQEVDVRGVRIPAGRKVLLLDAASGRLGRRPAGRRRPARPTAARW